MSSGWNAALFGIILDSSLRVSLVAVIVAVILVTLRVRSSGVRHAAWTAVLCAMLLMPVLPYCVPSIAIPVPEAAHSAVATLDMPEISVPAQESLGSQTLLPQTVPAVATAPLPRREPDAAPARASIWPAAALGLYAFGLLFFLSRLFMGWRAMAQVARSGQRILCGPESTTDAGKTGRRGIVPVYESGLIAAPMTIGVISAKIMLPTAWTLWPEEKLRAVLAHELAHMRRRDTLVTFVARLNRCIFWFHPLAWWLEKKLATTAEQACDDAGVRAIGKARRYAEVLLDMAEAVRRSGGRFSLQGVGVDGSGLLGQRIDRILRGDFFREVSRTRKVVVAFGCAAAIFVAVACHQQAAPPAPLQQDAEVAKRLAQQKADSEFWTAARGMNAQQVADLEASLKKNPEDLVTLKKLLLFYTPVGVPVPGEKGKWAPICAQVLGEKECIAARRPHILWLIEHHPESDLNELANIYPTAIDPLPDPVGYAEAKKLWLAQISWPDVSVPVLKNAAYFFFTADKPLAEKMMLRAQALDPKGHWSAALGRLYAFTLVGSNDQRLGNVVRSVSLADAHGPYAQGIRKKLADSTDADMLYAAGQYLTHDRGLYEEHKIDFDAVALGKSYLERALQLNPQLVYARSVLVQQRIADRNRSMREILRNVPRESQYQTVSALPEGERFSFLPELAIEAYMEGESADYYKKDQAGAKAAWDRARKYAQDELQLASRLRDNPECGTNIYMGNIVLGMVTFREGNKQAAVNYMLAASRAPAAEDLDYYIPFHTRLTGYLLKYGERESVIEFLQRVAPLSTTSKTAWLDDANKIRRGIQPNWYPRDKTNQ